MRNQDVLGHRVRDYPAGGIAVSVHLAFALLLPATLLAVWGCEPSTAPPPTPLPYEIRDSAGVRIVENSGPIWDSLTALTVGPEPVVRIGVVNGELPYQFSDINGMARLSDGRIVVLDGLSRELRFFSPEGEHLFTAGQRGEGPGEFRSAGGLELLPGDTLQVEDFPNRIRFGPHGELVAQARIDWSTVKELGDFYAECSGAPIFLGDDILACGGSGFDARDGPVRDPLDIRFRSYLRVPWDASRLDTIATVASGGRILVWHNARPRILGPPYRTEGFFALGGSPRRSVAARSDRYELEVRDLSGTLLSLIRRSDGLRTPTPDELELRPVDISAPPGRSLSQTLPQLGSLPDVDSISLIQSVFVDDVNRVWAGTWDPAREGGPWYDVFDPEGRFLGSVEFPSRFVPLQIGAGFVVGVRRDEFDVEFVEMYALESRAPGSPAQLRSGQVGPSTLH